MCVCALVYVQPCVRVCVCSCVFVLGNDAAPVCVNLSMSRAETKISSLKQVRQPFGRHAPCLPCVRGIGSGACLCSYYHFFFLLEVWDCSAVYWKETNLLAGMFEPETIRTWFLIKMFWKLHYGEENICSDLICCLPSETILNHNRICVIKPLHLFNVWFETSTSRILIALIHHSIKPRVCSSLTN